jgi:hypothetical protein
MSDHKYGEDDRDSEDDGERPRPNFGIDNSYIHAEPRSLLVRGFTADDLRRLDSAASASGMSRNEWVKRTLLRAALAPVVRKNYALKGLGPEDITISIDRYERFGDPNLDVEVRAEGLERLDDKQTELYEASVRLVERNQAGDREKAIGLLQQAGFEVYEVPATPPSIPHSSPPEPLAESSDTD